MELLRIPGVQRDQKRRVRGNVDVSRYHVVTFILRDNVIFKLTSPSRPLLPSPAPSVTTVTRLPAYTGINRHASGIRIELVDNTVPGEAMVGGVTHPR